MKTEVPKEIRDKLEAVLKKHHIKAYDFEPITNFHFSLKTDIAASHDLKVDMGLIMGPFSLTYGLLPDPAQEVLPLPPPIELHTGYTARPLFGDQPPLVCEYVKREARLIKGEWDQVEFEERGVRTVFIADVDPVIPKLGTGYVYMVIDQ